MVGLFPFAILTWRESVVGVRPTEMVYMQVERNWVSFSKPGFRGYGAGQVLGKNLGSVKWRMTEESGGKRRLRRLTSEANDLESGSRQIEEVLVDPANNAIVSQTEQLITPLGMAKVTSDFYDDRVEVHRLGPDGRTTTIKLTPSGGMEAVQRRFAPVGSSPKTFLLVDGIAGKFHEVRVERAGRFRGNWGSDSYQGNVFRFSCEGKEQTAMLTEQGELVRVEFDKEHSLVLMGQTESRRKHGA